MRAVSLCPERERAMAALQQEFSFDRRSLQTVNLNNTLEHFHRGSLWDALFVHGVLVRIIYIMSGLCYGSEDAVKSRVTISISSPVNNRMGSGCVLAPWFLNISIKRDLEKLLLNVFQEHF